MTFSLRSINVYTCQTIQRLCKWRRVQAMQAALSRLSPFHQNVFWLIRFDGFTIEAAAEELNAKPDEVLEALADVLLVLGRVTRS